MTIDEQVEKLHDRMFRNRFDPNKLMRDWKPDSWQAGAGGDGRKAETVIREHLEKGHKVSTGYFNTACRGFHTYMIFWKEWK